MDSDKPSEFTPDKTWWVINGQELLNALKLCASGENPDIVYLELWANADTEKYGTF